MRIPIIIANWKMHKTNKEACELVKEIREKVVDVTNVEIVICPPFTALLAVREIINNSKIALGAQNLHWEKQGAYTGEISPVMLKEIGCKYVIVGHSERRMYFHETDEIVNLKVKAALSHGLSPVMCLGETLEEREKRLTEKAVERQIINGLRDVGKEQILNVLIAYEPLWAIGSGKAATPSQAQEVHAFLRNLLVQLYSPKIASQIHIQYGGSVKPENMREFMKEEDIDGAMVGGASLETDSFVRIVKY